MALAIVVTSLMAGGVRTTTQMCGAMKRETRSRATRRKRTRRKRTRKRRNQTKSWKISRVYIAGGEGGARVVAEVK